MFAQVAHECSHSNLRGVIQDMGFMRIFDNIDRPRHLPSSQEPWVPLVDVHDIDGYPVPGIKALEAGAVS